MINALNQPVAENMQAASGVENMDAGSSPANEMLARQHGYPSYDAMIQFLRNREVTRQGGPAPVGAAGQPQQARPAPVDNRGAFQKLLDGLAGRP